MKVTVTVNGEERTADVEPRLLLVHSCATSSASPAPTGAATRPTAARASCSRRHAGEELHRARRDGRRARRRHRRGPRGTRRPRPRPAGLHGVPRAAVRLLHAGHDDHRAGAARPQPRPDRGEIREAISGQLCRCTGYDNIVTAVRWAAEHATPRSEEPVHDRTEVPVARPATRSASAGCCARRTPGSCAAGATTSTTSSCPACCTAPSCAARTPTRGSSRSTRRRPRPTPRSRPSSPAPCSRALKLAWMPTLSYDTQAVLATDKVRFQGQEVAFVVAEDRYSARDALELIEVEYEPLPPVIDARRALDADAPVSATTRRARPTTTSSTGRPATRPPPTRPSPAPTSSWPRTCSTRGRTRRRWRRAARSPTWTRSPAS